MSHWLVDLWINRSLIAVWIRHSIVGCPIDEGLVCPTEKVLAGRPVDEVLICGSVYKVLVCGTMYEVLVWMSHGTCDFDSSFVVGNFWLYWSSSMCTPVQVSPPPSTKLAD